LNTAQGYGFMAMGSAILAISPEGIDSQDFVDQHEFGFAVTDPEVIGVDAIIRKVLELSGECMVIYRELQR
jgi:hypothetical protein